MSRTQTKRVPEEEGHVSDDLWIGVCGHQPYGPTQQSRWIQGRLISPSQDCVSYLAFRHRRRPAPLDLCLDGIVFRSHLALGYGMSQPLRIQIPIKLQM